ncbi:conserved hypothetical protein [Vibrio phage 455E52-1]|nr:conserved hypothetical protein [Vibrio phage 455E52-1]CAH9016054.1 conserved hypothetical protein [Vibrio phage 120E34-1]
MGIDISGGMIIGHNASKVKEAVSFNSDDSEMYGTDGNIHEDFYYWYESEKMEPFSFYFDAPEDSQVLGFVVEDIEPLSDNFEAWISEVKEKSQKFKDLTGLEPELIGMQNVW